MKSRASSRVVRTVIFFLREAMKRIYHILKRNEPVLTGLEEPYPVVCPRVVFVCVKLFLLACVEAQHWVVPSSVGVMYWWSDYESRTELVVKWVLPHLASAIHELHRAGGAPFLRSEAVTFHIRPPSLGLMLTVFWLIFMTVPMMKCG